MRTIVVLATLVAAGPGLADDEPTAANSGLTGYGRKGVLEVGGSAGMMIAPGFRTMNIAPLFGWFVADNLELSAIVGLSNIKAGDSSSTVWAALVEPSYHVPLDRTTFGFLGMGIGTSYVSGLGAGLAVAPRLGVNVLVGRSGVLTPSLSFEYTTHHVEIEDEMKNITLAAASSSMRINLGYTAMW